MPNTDPVAPGARAGGAAVVVVLGTVVVGTVDTDVVVASKALAVEPLSQLVASMRVRADNSGPTASARRMARSSATLERT